MIIAAGQAAFNQQSFFAAHEWWEEAWRQASGPARETLQGLIQIAAGCHHLQQGRRGPGQSLLEKGREKLAKAPGAVPPLDGAGLLTQITALLAEIARTPDAVAVPLSLHV
jgi:predicted metal-dependent hydrolase